MRLLEIDQRLGEYIGRATPVYVDVSDAAKWYYSESTQEYWDLSEDFHALTPPAKYTYLEFEIPLVHRIGAEVRTLPQFVAGVHLGCAVQCFEIPDEDRKLAGENQLLEKFANRTGIRTSRVRWDSDDGDEPRFILEAMIFIGSKQTRKVDGVLNLVMYLDHQGKYTGNPSALLVSSNTAQELELFFPFALALSLMNCKNVELIEDQRHLTRQERRRMEREKRPLITYKWLHIKQLRKQVDRDFAQQETKHTNRLHFVRAHWATYTKDSPLFGKYEGTFFKPSHVRGNLVAGIALKDYKVDHP